MDHSSAPFPFGDIEQDNNPSFYGNHSVLNNPYGGGQTTPHDNAEVEAEAQVEADNHQNSPSIEHKRESENLHQRATSNNMNGFLDINDSLIMSNQIASMLTKKDIKIEVSSTERLMNSSVIMYCVQLTDQVNPPVIVKRRYSEFKSLRDTLARLFPTLIVAPIPQKHTLLNYLISSLNTNEELLIVQTRKRLFTLFLQDIVFNSDERIAKCPLFHKFLDPSYEMNWDNAIHEPPASLVPNSLLLANPIDPTNQNGLYSLLPNINSGFDHPKGNGPGFNLISGSSGDGMGSLKSFNDDLGKLREQIHILELKQRRKEEEKFQNQGSIQQQGSTHQQLPSLNEELMLFNTEKFLQIPQELIDYETTFQQSVKVTGDLDKLNSRTSRNLKQLIHTLMELGSNLNNFSLQIHSNTSRSFNDYDNQRNHYDQDQFENDNQRYINGELQLSSQVEKFGSTIDSIFLNYESYLNVSFLPKWQEKIHQLIQYYLTALQVVRFYKLKLLQHKILYRARFRKSQELESIHQNFDSHQSIDEALKLGLNLNSPSITQAVKSFERKQNRQFDGSSGRKKSWYGLFGGKVNNSTSNSTSTSNSNSNYDYSSESNYGGLSNNGGSSRESSKELIAGNYLHKLNQLEKEIDKLDQLVQLTNDDMIALTSELNINFNDFTKELEKKWLEIMIDFIRGGRKLFEENIAAWQKMRNSIDI